MPPGPTEPLVKRTLKLVDVALILAIFVLLELVVAPHFARAVYNLANNVGLKMSRYPLPILIQIVTQEGPILLVIFCFAALRGLSPGDLGFRKTPFFWILAGLGLLFLVLPVRLCAGLAAHYLSGGTLENIGGIDDGRAFPLLASPAIAGLPIVFMVGVVAPMVEELIFRGIVYVWLRQKIGVWPAAILSALVFGLIHTQIAMGISAVVMGIALAWLYERSRSLWVPFALHAINNTLVIALAFFALGMQDLIRLPG